MKIILTICLIFFVGVLLSQNISINTTGNPANSSALLDVDASPGNNLGVLLPRLTTAERDAISSPATGLFIYNTTTNRLNWFDGVVWQTTSGTLVLISNSESDVTGTATTASVKNYTVTANTYSQIMVEAEIGLDQSGNNNAEWQFDLLYAGTVKATSNIKLAGNNANDQHKTVGVIKYSEIMTAGGIVKIDVTSVSLNGTWRILSFRVYGVI